MLCSDVQYIDLYTLRAVLYYCTIQYTAVHTRSTSKGRKPITIYSLRLYGAARVLGGQLSVFPLGEGLLSSTKVELSSQVEPQGKLSFLRAQRRFEKI